jgi:hypothetical protein
MAANIRLTDGRQVIVRLSGKRVVEELSRADKEDTAFARFKSTVDAPVWIAASQVVCVEERADLD